jgi:hypothetical protein
MSCEKCAVLSTVIIRLGLYGGLAGYSGRIPADMALRSSRGNGAQGIPDTATSPANSPYSSHSETTPCVFPSLTVKPSISQGCGDMAGAVFDEHGALRPEFCTPAPAQGTTVWKSGFGLYDLLLIDEIQVTLTCQCQRIGIRLLQARL